MKPITAKYKLPQTVQYSSQSIDAKMKQSRSLEYTCFESVISSWSSVSGRCLSMMSCPVEFVTWILCPWTEVNFKVTIKRPLGVCGGCTGWWWSCGWKGGSSIVWKNYTWANSICDVVNSNVTLITISSYAFKYNLNDNNNSSEINM